MLHFIVIRKQVSFVIKGNLVFAKFYTFYVQLLKKTSIRSNVSECDETTGICTCNSQEKGNLPTKVSDMGGVGVCHFPFKWKDTTYSGCINPKDYGGVGWCAWDPIYDENRWGYCTPKCPLGKQFKILSIRKEFLINHD